MPIRSRMKPRLLIPLLILWGLTACEQPTDNTATLGSLAGEVRDGNSGSLIGKAQVRAVLNSVADTTAFPGLIRWEDGEAVWWDTVGTFLLDSLNTGLDTIIVSRELYYTQEYLVDIAPDANEVDFYLEPLCPYDSLVIQGWQYVRILGQWYLRQGLSLFLTHESQIVVKFRDDVSEAEIEAFNLAMNVTLIKINDVGQTILQVPENTDPVCVVLEYYNSGLVEYVLV